MSGARFSVSHYGTPFSFRLSLLLPLAAANGVARVPKNHLVDHLVNGSAKVLCENPRASPCLSSSVVQSIYLMRQMALPRLSLVPSRLLTLCLPSLSLQVEDRSLSPGGRAGSRKRQRIFSVVYPTRFRAGQRTGSTFSRTRNPNSCRFFFPPDPQATRTENCTRQLK